MVGFTQRLYIRWKESPTVRNISKIYIGDMTSKVLGFGSALLLIRGMTKSDYASYVAFTSIAAIAVGLVGGGINKAMIRFSAEHISRTGEKPYSLYILSVILEVGIFLALLMIILISPTHSARLLLGQEKYASLIPMSMLFGLGSLLIEIGRSILQAEERFNVFIGTLWLKQGSVFLVVAALWLSQGMVFKIVGWSFTLLQLLIGACITSFSIVRAGSVNWRRRFAREKYLVQQFLSASGWLIAYFITLAAFSRMGVLMLSRFGSEADLANYGVAFSYYSIALLLLGSIGAVLNPKFSRIEMQVSDRQHKFLLEWLRYTIWIGVPVVLFILFGKPLFVFVNGVQYENAFPILAILAVGVWLSLMLSPLTNILMSRKQFRSLFFLGVIAFIVNFLANFFGVQMWGGVGAAIAIVLSHNIVLQIPILWIVSR